MTALSVLVVEDDAMVGLLLAEMLEEMGYTVCAVAATEDDAVEQAARCKPGLVIVDERLREGRGVAVVERILEAGPIPCVFIGGSPENFGPRHAVKVLQRPFDETDLVNAIRDVVGASDAPVAHDPAPAQIVK